MDAKEVVLVAKKGNAGRVGVSNAVYLMLVVVAAASALL